MLSMKKVDIKNFFKSINLFEIIWIVSVVVILLTLIILVPDLMFEDRNNTLVVVCSVISIIASPICELLISKQCRYWTLFSLVFVEITDIIMLFNLRLYSSALISLLFWIPFDLITFIKWGGTNKDDIKHELTKVRTFNWWSNILIVMIMVIAGLLLGWLLSFIPNYSESMVVAFSNVFEIANGIFLLTRHNEQWFAWLGYLICEIIIWVSLGHYIMLITVFAMIINTIYGIVRWLLYIKSRTGIDKYLIS